MSRQSPAPRDRRLWTKSEDDVLRTEAEAQASRDGSVTDWCAIAENLPSRTNKDCRKRWSKISGGVSKGPWSEAEDDRLRSAVASRGTRWTEVAKSVETRNADRKASPWLEKVLSYLLTELECSKRWLHFLDPRLDRGKWSPEDDCKLIHAVRESGTDWKRICDRHFPQRSATNVKNRYNNIKQRTRLETTQTAERCGRSSDSASSVSPASSTADSQGQWTAHDRPSGAIYQSLSHLSEPSSQGDAAFSFPQDYATWGLDEGLSHNGLHSGMDHLQLPNTEAEWSRSAAYSQHGAAMSNPPEQHQTYASHYAPVSTGDGFMQHTFSETAGSSSQTDFQMPPWANSNDYLAAFEAADRPDVASDQRFGININEIPPNAVTGLVSYLSNSDYQYTIRREGSTSRTEGGTMLRSQRASSQWSSPPGTVSVQIGELTLPALRHLMGLLNASAFRGHAHITTG